MSTNIEVFTWKRDLKNVNWSSTLRYNTLRAAGAGVAWCIIALLAGVKWQAFTMLLFPVFYYVSLLPFGLLAGWLSGLGVPWIGLFAAIAALMICVGDPLVFFLKKFRPEIVPIDKAPFLSLKTIIFILNDPNSLADLSERKEISSTAFSRR